MACAGPWQHLWVLPALPALHFGAKHAMQYHVCGGRESGHWATPGTGRTDAHGRGVVGGLAAAVRGAAAVPEGDAPAAAIALQRGQTLGQPLVVVAVLQDRVLQQLSRRGALVCVLVEASRHHAVQSLQERVYIVGERQVLVGHCISIAVRHEAMKSS